MRPVHNIAHKLRPKWQYDLAAIDVSHLLLVHDEQMVTALAAGNIRIFPQFDITFWFLKVNRRPSPHVPSPSGVNQSTRIYPAPPLPCTIMSPKS